ncbi:MAG: hypothetical protein HY720_17360, partial [Planctomycetes bacterium]|nr:hypothetical protein [Planctomycetota bacterium]
MKAALRTIVAGSLALLWGLVSPARSQDPVDVYLQEKYVPEETFLRLQKENPGGVVMSLSEYRALVVSALGNAAAAEEAPLPPVECSVLSARYEGKVHTGTARFTARLVLQAGRDEWVSCDLGSLPENLGTVRVDGEPGWVVLLKAPEGETESASLVVRGKGVHEVDLTFHLPVEEKEGDRFAVSGPLPRSLAAELELVVPGKAEGTSEPGLLARELQEGTTRFRLGLGSSGRFRIEWRSREAEGENAPLLLASHRLLYRPSAEDPRFWWEATVEVARKAVSEVVFEEPAGTRVVGLEGPLVGSYRREGGKIAVLLREELLGSTSFHFHGVLDAVPERIVLGAPGLEGAYTNWGFLSLADPGSRTLRVESSELLEELAVAEAALPAVEPRDPGAPEPVAIRAFRFRSSGARLVAELADRPVRFEAASASALVLGETAAFLHGSWQIAPIEGSLHELSIRLPAPWKFVSLAERGSLGARSDVVALPDGPAILVRLANAARKDRPLEFDLALELTAYPADRSWKEWPLDLPLPWPAGAERHESTLGIFLARPLDLGATDLEGWNPAGAREIALVGFGLERPEEMRLAASFWTDRDRPVVKARLTHRPSRGEYRAVTHLLAAENRVRVRCDLALAVVDTGLDELSFRLPPLPEKVAVTIEGPGIREVKHGNLEGLHELRFVKPWVGLRPFRIEYDIEQAGTGSLPVPVVEIEGDFGGERFLVLQSQGSVEVSASPGAGLMAVDGDEIPGFAQAWSRGRFLGAYRIVSGEGGTVERILYERAPVLPNVIRRMDLATRIGAGGTLRTEVEILLAYGGLQALGVELPPGASLAGVTVAGEPTRTVWKKEGVLSVPLPARSYAIVSLVYEEPSPEVRPELGAAGTIELAGPEFRDDGGSPIPVGETTWKLHPPRGYRFAVGGGNLRGPGPGGGIRWPGIAGSFPRFTTWEVDGAGETEPSEIALTRMGGAPRIELSYERLDRGRGTRQGVFLSVVLAAVFLYARRRRAPFWWFASGGLALGTLLPIALSWDSTLLLVPACEALVCVLALAGAVPLARRIRPYLHKPLWGARGLVLVIGLAFASASLAQEERAREPWGSVWVSSGREDSPPGSAEETRVFLTEDGFHRLHKLAFPKPDEPRPFPLDIAIGAAAYVLEIADGEFKLAATVPVRLFGSSWGTIDIPRGATPLVSLALDGKACGVFGDSKVEIQGEGNHELALEWRGEIETVPGVSRVRAPLLGGPAATLSARLPEGAELRAAGGALAVVQGRDLSIDLGRARELDLSWHFPREEGTRGSLLASASYSGLALSPYGYSVERYEEVTVSGRPADRLEYRVPGDWQIAGVAGDDVSEWVVT